jgi:type I restriction enzyme S subunit
MNKYKSYIKSGIEWIGEIPEHWNKLKIGRSFDLIGSGTTPNTNVDKFYNEGNINWLNTGDLNDGYIFETSKKITEFALKETSLRIFPNDSIVIALYGATIGK